MAFYSLSESQRDLALRVGLGKYLQSYKNSKQYPDDVWDQSFELADAFRLEPAKLLKSERQVWADAFGNLDDMCLDVSDLRVDRQSGERRYDICHDAAPRFRTTVEFDDLVYPGDGDDDFEFFTIETGKGGKQGFAVPKKRMRLA